MGQSARQLAVDRYAWSGAARMASTAASWRSGPSRASSRLPCLSRETDRLYGAW
jgi:hypothetical protein